MTNLRSVINPNNILLILLVLMLFFVPFLPIQKHFNAYNSLFSFILRASSFSLQSGSRKIIFSAAVVLVILEWIAIQVNLSMLNIISRILEGLFFTFIVFGLIQQTATARKVTERVIVDSISGYLLLGVVFGIIAFVVFRLQPDAFHFPEGSMDPVQPKEKMSDLIYFTFVTYTTTGFGDILPVTPGVKSLATLISVTGQLYIAIIIALLVGKFASGVRG